MDPVSLLRELIRVPSPSGGEGELAKLLKDVLGSVGIDKVWIDELGNVVAVLKGDVGGGSIVLEGHLDTVGPGDVSKWIVDPYSGEVIEGRIYGRGAADMKGAIAAQVAAIEGLKGGHLDVYLTYTTHEETAEGAAFKYVLEKDVKPRPEVVIIGEATSLNVAVGQRGRAVLRFDVVGEEAHASMPEEGLNALLATAEVARSVVNAEIPEDEVLGKPSVSPTILKCSSRDVPHIPGRCSLYVDVRFGRGVDEECLLKVMSKYCEMLSSGGLCRECGVSINEEVLRFWTGTELRVREFFPAWLCTDEGVINTALKALTTRASLSARRYVWRFSTDGVYSAGVAGYVTIGFGPGSEALAHKVNEYVSIEELLKSVKGYRALIEELDKYLFTHAR